MVSVDVKQHVYLLTYLLNLTLVLFSTPGGVQDPHLSLQHQQPGRHLPGHPEGELEPGADHLQGAAVRVLTPHRLQPRRPPRVQHRQSVFEQSPGARPSGAHLDSTIRHGLQQLERPGPECACLLPWRRSVFCGVHVCVLRGGEECRRGGIGLASNGVCVCTCTCVCVWTPIEFR